MSIDAGLFVVSFSEDELITIRLSDISFHQKPLLKCFSKTFYDHLIIFHINFYKSFFAGNIVDVKIVRYKSCT